MEQLSVLLYRNVEESVEKKIFKVTLCSGSGCVEHKFFLNYSYFRFSKLVATLVLANYTGCLWRPHHNSGRVSSSFFLCGHNSTRFIFKFLVGV